MKILGRGNINFMSDPSAPSGETVLKYSGRTANWNGPQHDIPVSKENLENYLKISYWMKMTKNSKNSIYEDGYGFSNGIMKVLKSGKEFYIFCTSNCLTPGKYCYSKFINPHAVGILNKAT